MPSSYLSNRLKVVPEVSDELLHRVEAARRLNISAGTLAVWQSEGNYDLRCIKIKGRSFYKKLSLIRNFLKSDRIDLLEEPLLTRGEAACYLEKSAGTLAVWDCTKRYDLHPIKVGHCVRYSRRYLNCFLFRQLEGKSVPGR